jgi:hypothetical protein
MNALGGIATQPGIVNRNKPSLIDYKPKRSEMLILLAGRCKTTYRFGSPLLKSKMNLKVCLSLLTVLVLKFLLANGPFLSFLVLEEV